MAEIKLGDCNMIDSFDKLANICITNNLGAETVDYLVDIKKALEEKEKLDQALDKACDIIADLNDCNNSCSSKYPKCSLRKSCGRFEMCGIFDGCISTKEYWKKYLMGL